MKGAGARCKTCVAANGSVGGHTGGGCFKTVNDNTTNQYKSTAGETGCGCDLDLRIRARGSFKEVCFGVYTTGSRKGEECVAKKFKTHISSKDDYFDKDVKAATKASEIILKFNNTRLSRISPQLL